MFPIYLKKTVHLLYYVPNRKNSVTDYKPILIVLLNDSTVDKTYTTYPGVNKPNL